MEKPKLNIINLELGKVPPQAVDLEEAVLGALMLEKDSITKINHILSVESFYKDAHQKIYSAICDLSSKEQAIDILTVTEELRKKDELELVGGPYYITQLTSRIASAAHIERHARIVEEKFIQREIIRASSEIQIEAFDNSLDVADLLDKYNKDNEDINNIINIGVKSKKVSDSINETINLIDERVALYRSGKLQGIPSGFIDLDKLTNGWQKSDLIIIASRPSMGKTSLSLCFASNSFKKGYKPCFYSLEMTNHKLIEKMIAGNFKIEFSKIRSGRLTDEEIKRVKTSKESVSDLYINDSSGVDMNFIKNDARRLWKKGECDLVFIDYLQLITEKKVKGESRDERIGEITRKAKQLAKDLDIPVLLLCQLNRDVEKRAGKKPQMSDLRESGNIEAHADIIIFPYRPAKYDITEDSNGNMLAPNLMLLEVGKHRNGATGSVGLTHNESLTEFYDLPQGEMPF